MINASKKPTWLHTKTALPFAGILSSPETFRRYPLRITKRRKSRVISAGTRVHMKKATARFMRPTPRKSSLLSKPMPCTTIAKRAAPTIKMAFTILLAAIT